MASFSPFKVNFLINNFSLQKVLVIYQISEFELELCELVAIEDVQKIEDWVNNCSYVVG